MHARAKVPWIALLAGFLMGCGGGSEDAESSDVGGFQELASPKLTPGPIRPRNDDLYPCAQCHAESAEQAAEEGLLEPNLERREVGDPHDVIHFTHDAQHRWCLDCHDAWKRDSLRLAGGTLISLTEESVQLCGQCHGPQYRDWRAGVHGRRLGEWESTGEKTNYRCVNCHDPHSPQIKPIQPQPAPLPPGGRHGH